MSPRDTYTHGHHASVLRSHTRRTAADSAAYLLPHLRSGMTVLDVGCGPGTITADLARVVAPGAVVGVDNTDAPLAAARAAAAGLDNVTFAVADVYALPDAGGTVDVVHAHQVLQHLTDPVAALGEMRRVRTPAGLVAARDADYAGMHWYSADPLLDAWLTLYRDVARANGAEPDAGRRLLAWARAAGFTEVAASASLWCYATPEDRAWWGGLWSERIVESAIARQAVDLGLADAATLQAMSVAWRRWSESDDGWFVVPHGEVLARG